MVESLCTWDCCAILRIRRIPSISMWDTVRTRNLCWIGSRCTMLGARGHWSTGTTTNVFLWESIRISICWDICRRIRSLHSRRWNTRVCGLWCWHARSGWPHSWNVSSRICGRPILVNKIIKQIRTTISNQDRKWKMQNTLKQLFTRWSSFGFCNFSSKAFGTHLMLCSSAIEVKVLILVCISGAPADSFSITCNKHSCISGLG